MARLRVLAIPCAIFAVINFATLASGLQCYQCLSRVDSLCADPFNATQAMRPLLHPTIVLVDCSPIGSIVRGCNKVVYVSRNNPYDVHVERGCRQLQMANQKFCETVAPQTNNGLTVTHCSMCTHDRCNAAATTKSQLTAAIALSMAALAMTRLYL